jgi:hypothetical protein
MAAASAASLDPESLVDTFLWEKASLRRTYMNHQLFEGQGEGHQEGVGDHLPQALLDPPP